MGSDLSNPKSIKGKAKRKMITQRMVLGLVDASQKHGSSEMKKGYWNTYHCQNRVHTANGRVFGKYCKNRFCTLCCANRKADIINRYLPVIKTWEKPYLVTLTIKSVPFYRLNSVMKCMMSEFRAIVETCRKRNQRGKGIKLIGIRSLESNFNPAKKTYNPHFHCIVANKLMAEILVNQWQERSRPGWTNYQCQNITAIFNNLTALIEVVKYGSKIFTEPDVTKRSKRNGSEQIYVAALNNIFHSMKGLRIFERFGFDLPKQTIGNTAPAAVVRDYCEWLFHPEFYDWLNVENGNPLTNYHPSKELLNLLNTNIDSLLE
ncbi:MAG: hypothetical protein ABIQ88_23655 [Chitinophagaceae bacterium]